jgi:hypothetical protein
MRWLWVTAWYYIVYGVLVGPLQGARVVFTFRSN